MNLTVIVLNIQAVLGVDVCYDGCREGSLEGDVIVTISHVEGTQH